MSTPSASTAPPPASSAPPALAPGAKPLKAPKGEQKAVYQLTPEQEAKKLARAAAKGAAPKEGGAAESGKRSKEQLEMGRFLTREWVNVAGEDKGEGSKLRVGSWNVSLLSQGLMGQRTGAREGSPELTLIAPFFRRRRCSLKRSSVS